MKLSLSSEAEHELVEGAQFYAREANEELGHAFISEFERSVTLLREQPRLGAVWRGPVRRLPLRRFPYSIIDYLSESEVRVLAVASPESKARVLARSFVIHGRVVQRLTRRSTDRLPFPDLPVTTRSSNGALEFNRQVHERTWN